MSNQQRAHTPYRKIVRSSLRAVVAVAILTTIYYLLPLKGTSRWLAVTILAIGLAALVALVVFQVHTVMSSAFPALRAIEALAVSIPLFLLLFASAYVAIESLSSKAFSEPLTHTDALYFTVTVFVTVGFGDITPTSEAARLLVTGQMIADVVIIGVAIKAIAGAVERRRAQQ